MLCHKKGQDQVRDHILSESTNLHVPGTSFSITGQPRIKGGEYHGSEVDKAAMAMQVVRKKKLAAVKAHGMGKPIDGLV